jgi:hypothetical protein
MSFTNDKRGSMAIKDGKNLDSEPEEISGGAMDEIDGS